MNRFFSGAKARVISLTLIGSLLSGSLAAPVALAGGRRSKPAPQAPPTQVTQVPAEIGTPEFQQAMLALAAQLAQQVQEKGGEVEVFEVPGTAPGTQHPAAPLADALKNQGVPVTVHTADRTQVDAGLQAADDLADPADAQLMIAALKADAAAGNPHAQALLDALKADPEIGGASAQGASPGPVSAAPTQAPAPAPTRKVGPIARALGFKNGFAVVRHFFHQNPETGGTEFGRPDMKPFFRGLGVKTAAVATLYFLGFATLNASVGAHHFALPGANMFQGWARLTLWIYFFLRYAREVGDFKNQGPAWFSLLCNLIQEGLGTAFIASAIVPDVPVMALVQNSAFVGSMSALSYTGIERVRSRIEAMGRDADRKAEEALNRGDLGESEFQSQRAERLKARAGQLANRFWNGLFPPIQNIPVQFAGSGSPILWTQFLWNLPKMLMGVYGIAADQCSLVFRRHLPPEDKNDPSLDLNPGT